jgi:hypothetical protein
VHLRQCFNQLYFKTWWSLFVSFFAYCLSNATILLCSVLLFFYYLSFLVSSNLHYIHGLLKYLLSKRLGFAWMVKNNKCFYYAKCKEKHILCQTMYSVIPFPQPYTIISVSELAHSCQGNRLFMQHL